MSSFPIALSTLLSTFLSFFFFPSPLLLSYQGPRAQIDRKLYRKGMQEAITRVPNLTVVPAAVEDLILDDNNHVRGIVLGERERKKEKREGEDERNDRRKEKK